MDGLEVCRILRSEGLRAPILMLTAKDTPDDKVAGLDSGADDYLTKPFHFTELLARVRALLRRVRAPGETILRAGDLILDPRRRSVTRGGRAIELTGKEYALLEYMLRHPNQPLPRARLLAHAWREEEEVLTNIVDVYVSRLRRKLDEDPRKPLILTEHAVGYRLVVEEEK
jgi:DNA-binding response OmpR family regulator